MWATTLQGPVDFIFVQVDLASHSGCTTVRDSLGVGELRGCQKFGNTGGIVPSWGGIMALGATFLGSYGVLLVGTVQNCCFFMASRPQAPSVKILQSYSPKKERSYKVDNLSRWATVTKWLVLFFSFLASFFFPSKGGENPIIHLGSKRLSVPNRCPPTYSDRPTSG